MRNIIFVLAAATMLSACVTNQTGGAVIGGAAGGILGSTLGGGSGRLIGTGVGAVLGTMAGSAVGASMDRQNSSNVSTSQRHISAGEEAAYNRGRAEREAQIQAQREENAYMRGLRGN
jgi:uncharacterized protein YcfJ